MEIRMYFQMMRRGWWIILLITLVALATALGVSFIAAPKYKATARFIVTPATNLVDRSQVLSSINTLDNQVITSTYAEVMNSERIYSDSLSLLQLQPLDLEKYKYEAVVVASTSVLELTVTGPDPQMAARLANAIGNKTISFISSLNQVYNFDFLDIAVPDPEPYWPNPLLNGSLALVLGFIVGAVVAIMNEQLRTPFETIRQRRHFDEITGVYNTRHFNRLVDDELAQNPENVLSIGIVELNGLRDSIDALPLITLQRVLQSATEILRRELRGNDVIGRWNDISFIIMLPNTSGTAARRIFERIFQSLERPIELDQLGTTLEFDSHIGAAEFSSGISTEELFDKVNSALDQARRAANEPVYVWEIKNPFWTQPIIDEN
jgi:diguanylate cyclase (GGDEF)-like protein